MIPAGSEDDGEGEQVTQEERASFSDLLTGELKKFWALKDDVKEKYMEHYKRMQEDAEYKA